MICKIMRKLCSNNNEEERVSRLQQELNQQEKKNWVGFIIKWNLFNSHLRVVVLQNTCETACQLVSLLLSYYVPFLCKMYNFHCNRHICINAKKNDDVCVCSILHEHAKVLVWKIIFYLSSHFVCGIHTRSQMWF